MTSIDASAAALTVPASLSSDEVEIGRLVQALYEMISGPPEVPRDWERQREVFSAGARMAILHSRSNQTGVLEALTPAEYRDSRDPFLVRSGFFETEVRREVSIHGRVAHVFSEFEGRQSVAGDVFVRGWNSIQLAHSGTRWWIVSVMWEGMQGVSRPTPTVAVPLEHDHES